MAQSKPSAKGNIVPIRGGMGVASQLPLLALQAHTAISSNLGSADLKKIVRCHDSHFYALKSLDDHPLLPATEFLCYKIAAACEVPTPVGAIVLTPPNQLPAFGSRWEGGLTELSVRGPVAVMELYRECSGVMSATLALDLFLGNEDRHMGNFLFRRTHGDRFAAVAIDYSRAFLIKGFPQDRFPQSPNTATRTTINSHQKSGIWNGPLAVHALSQILRVTTEHLGHWMKEMPSEWLPASDAANLLQWWGTDAFRERFNQTLQML